MQGRKLFLKLQCITCHYSVAGGRARPDRELALDRLGELRPERRGVLDLLVSELRSQAAREPSSVT